MYSKIGSLGNPTDRKGMFLLLGVDACPPAGREACLYNGHWSIQPPGRQAQRSRDRPKISFHLFGIVAILKQQATALKCVEPTMTEVPSTFDALYSRQAEELDIPSSSHRIVLGVRSVCSNNLAVVDYYGL